MKNHKIYTIKMTQWWYLISQLFLSHTIAFHVGLSELKQGHFASEHLKLLFSKILYSKMAPCGRAAICLMPNAASACQVIDRFIFWFWESPTTGWHLPGQKHLHFLIIWSYFLPYLLNDCQMIRSIIHFSKPLLCVMPICGDWLI